MRTYLTWILRLDQVKHLAEQILEWQGFDAHSLHPFTLLFIKVFQLEHRQDTITINIHAPKPVLYTTETNGR